MVGNAIVFEVVRANFLGARFAADLESTRRCSTALRLIDLLLEKYSAKSLIRNLNSV